MRREVIWEKTYRGYLNDRERRKKPPTTSTDELQEDGTGTAVTTTNKRTKRVNMSKTYVNNVMQNLPPVVTTSKKVNYAVLEVCLSCDWLFMF